MAGDDGMKDAMGVLTLLFGLAGVVFGYYFGRLPSDAHATQAQIRAEEAKGDKDVAMNAMQTAAIKCREVTDQMHETMESSGLTLRTASSTDLSALQTVIMDADNGLKGNEWNIPENLDLSIGGPLRPA